MKLYQARKDKHTGQFDVTVNPPTGNPYLLSEDYGSVPVGRQMQDNEATWNLLLLSARIIYDATKSNEYACSLARCFKDLILDYIADQDKWQINQVFVVDFCKDPSQYRRSLIPNASRY